MTFDVACIPSDVGKSNAIQAIYQEVYLTLWLGELDSRPSLLGNAQTEADSIVVILESLVRQWKCDGHGTFYHKKNSNPSKTCKHVRV